MDNNISMGSIERCRIMSWLDIIYLAAVSIATVVFGVFTVWATIELFTGEEK